MKRISIYLLLGFIMMIFAKPFEAQSQFHDCNFFCPEIEWETNISIKQFLVPGTTGCWVEVTYQRRVADCDEPHIPPVCDFQILNIEPLPGSVCTDFIGNEDDLFEFAMMHILTEEKWSACEPPDSNCTIHFRVSGSTCWKWDGALPGPGGGDMPAFVPCEATGCCYFDFRVCRDEHGNRTITPLGSFGSGICSGNPEECINMCYE